MPSKAGHPSRRAKTDKSIMGTNDSSIVSKRSVSKLYFPNEPDFYQPFVQKFQRRHPLINRGYWIRMHAIEHALLHFLQQHQDTEAVIINLGCGYDPLPFQFWHRHQQLCGKATFVDVDYPQLIAQKTKCILDDESIRGAISKKDVLPGNPPLHIRTEKYVALGCDLRDLNTLEKVLKEDMRLDSRPIMFVAEVSLTYMGVEDSDNLIRWSSSFRNARFCLLEQCLPDGIHHPFAKTMLSHFDKIQTPLQAIKKYPSLHDQIHRFHDLEWPSVKVSRSLWDLWSDSDFLSVNQRQGLDLIEPFDEWEEFALFAAHYFLLVASKEFNPELSFFCKAPTFRGTVEDIALLQESPCIKAKYITAPSQTSSRSIRRRFAAAFLLEKDTAAFHGGHGTQTRLRDADILARQTSTPTTSSLLSSPAQPNYTAMCHTITSIGDKQALMVGGRASPGAAFSNCWLFEDSLCSPTHPLEPARFRHCSISVTVAWNGLEVNSVLVFGGKSSNGSVLGDWALWIPDRGWQEVEISGPSPAPRFGAAMCTMGTTNDRGLVTGGMSIEGLIIADIWAWRLECSDNGVTIWFQDLSDDMPEGARLTYPRFGASLLQIGQRCLLVGGVAAKWIPNSRDEILLFSINVESRTVHVEHVQIQSRYAQRPLLIGCGGVNVSSDGILLAGGGAVCFSMGTYWNEGHIFIQDVNTSLVEDWRLLTDDDNVMPQHGATKQTGSPAPSSVPANKTRRKAKKQQQVAQVQRIQLQTREEFHHLVTTSKPAILEGLDLGPCTNLWTMDYLREGIGPGRSIIVHACKSDRMTFQDKNFSYAKMSFGDFVDGISKGEKSYLRSIASTQPTKHAANLAKDFPTIASDFEIPEMLSLVTENMHSSPLRISGPVSLWLHYDVLANILCQIRGTKTLRLFPPSDVVHLDYPPGGSSSNINVLENGSTCLRHLHPHDATLKPGDVLFIPPLWSHTATPNEGVSVAVNIFFRNLDKGYAAGKDVYGNRDLQAYENGRRNIERIVKAFQDVPADMSNFYLERLVAELKERMNKTR